MKGATEILEQCIFTSMECFDHCNICATDCNGKPNMLNCMKVCNECAYISFLFAEDCERDSPNLGYSIQLFIKACEDCATECEKHKLTSCQKCAQICRLCALGCKQLLLESLN